MEERNTTIIEQIGEISKLAEQLEEVSTNINRALFGSIIMPGICNVKESNGGIKNMLQDTSSTLDSVAYTLSKVLEELKEVPRDTLLSTPSSTDYI